MRPKPDRRGRGGANLGRAFLPYVSLWATDPPCSSLRASALKAFHGSIAILVNEHTASASEMIAGFAQENGLTRIVGTTTAGRLLSGNTFKLSHGYVFSLPVGAYYTWQGRLLEGVGVIPHVEVELSYTALQRGLDNQLGVAAAAAGE